jgi:RNA polymerase sigma-70 factor (ECF subfamily)
MIFSTRVLDLWSKHAKRVNQFLVRITSDPDASDDLTQDTFVRFGYYRGYVPPEREVRFLFQIARNVGRDWNKNARQRFHVPLEADIYESPLLDPESCVIDKERGEKIIAALAELPEQMRHAFLLCCIDEIPHTTIAERVGTTEGGSKMLVYRARLALRESLRSYMEDSA